MSCPTCSPRPAAPGSSPTPSERARTAVRKAIARAIDVIGASDDVLGAELRATITTGRRCSYVPDAHRPRRWHVVTEA